MQRYPFYYSYQTNSFIPAENKDKITKMIRFNDDFGNFILNLSYHIGFYRNSERYKQNPAMAWMDEHGREVDAFIREFRQKELLDNMHDNKKSSSGYKILQLPEKLLEFLNVIKAKDPVFYELHCQHLCDFFQVKNVTEINSELITDIIKITSRMQYNRDTFRYEVDMKYDAKPTREITKEEARDAQKVSIDRFREMLGDLYQHLGLHRYSERYIKGSTSEGNAELIIMEFREQELFGTMYYNKMNIAERIEHFSERLHKLLDNIKEKACDLHEFHCLHVCDFFQVKNVNEINFKMLANWLQQNIKYDLNKMKSYNADKANDVDPCDKPVVSHSVRMIK